MDLKDILAAKGFSEPPEVAAIKDYVAANFNGRTVGVRLLTDSIVITASSAAFAGSLKTHIPKLQTLLDTTKRIVIRIG